MKRDQTSRVPGWEPPDSSAAEQTFADSPGMEEAVAAVRARHAARRKIDPAPPLGVRRPPAFPELAATEPVDGVTIERAPISNPAGRPMILTVAKVDPTRIDPADAHNVVEAEMRRSRRMIARQMLPVGTPAVRRHRPPAERPRERRSSGSRSCARSGSSGDDGPSPSSEPPLREARSTSLTVAAARADVIIAALREQPELVEYVEDIYGLARLANYTRAAIGEGVDLLVSGGRISEAADGRLVTHRDAGSA